MHFELCTSCLHSNHKYNFLIKYWFFQIVRMTLVYWQGQIPILNLLTKWEIENMSSKQRQDGVWSRYKFLKKPNLLQRLFLHSLTCETKLAAFWKILQWLTWIFPKLFICMTPVKWVSYTFFFASHQDDSNHFIGNDWVTMVHAVNIQLVL